MVACSRIVKRLLAALVAPWLLAAGVDASGATCAVLAYHRFGPSMADSMTVRTVNFEQQITLLREHGYQTVPLATLVDGVSGKATLPAKAVAITVDDGHVSVDAELLPVITRLALPVTLFIYPSAISKADYAMTWAQLAALSRNPLITVQSHTYWHPNFRTERRRLSADAYAALVRTQLERSRTVLERRLGLPVSYLAWPYGIEDAALRQAAQAVGYGAAFSLGNRMISAGDAMLALPRFLVTDGYSAAGLLHALEQAAVPCPTGLR
jgi:peptidoglycan/xylan/chitin deacetylase (PgdA/CDA1 family)